MSDATITPETAMQITERYTHAINDAIVQTGLKSIDVDQELSSNAQIAALLMALSQRLVARNIPINEAAMNLAQTMQVFGAKV